MSLEAFAKAFNTLWAENLMYPDGLMGHLIGQHLAFDNQEINSWAVNLLQIQPNESVLEIGFGPGTAVAEMARTTRAHYIAGFDLSELMVKKASRLNQQAIKSGLVDLRWGSTDDIPDFDRTFNKVIAINNVMYWENPVDTLKTLQNLIEPGGLICLVIQRCEGYAFTEEGKQELSIYQNYMIDSGYQNVTIVGQPIRLYRAFQAPREILGICIYGFRPMENIIELTTSASTLLSA